MTDVIRKTADKIIDKVRYKEMIDRLSETQDLTDEEFSALITVEDKDVDAYLAKKADKTRQKIMVRTYTCAD